MLNKHQARYQRGSIGGSFIRPGGGYGMANKQALFGVNAHYISPLGQSMRNLGPTQYVWSGSPAFMGAMYQFGGVPSERAMHTRLLPYENGANIGDTYYKGMKGVLDYVRNGSVPNGDLGEMNPVAVEKMQTNQVGGMQ